MISEIKKSVSNILEERISSPFFGTLIVSWLIWNWEIVYVTLFVNQDLIKPLTKIEHITKHYNNSWYLIVFPLVSAILLITIVPLLGNWLFKISLNYEKQRTILREAADSNKRLTIEQSALIRNEILEESIKHQQQIDSKNNELKISKDQIDNLIAEKFKFKILFAQYGMRSKFNDVTQKVSEFLSSQKNINVKNDELGGDPIPNIKKELLIVYSQQNKIYTIKTKENNVIEFDSKNGLLIEKEESPKPNEITNSYTNMQTLEDLFPGKWKLEYTGKISGNEEFEIREKNKYFAKTPEATSFTQYFTLEEINIDIENNRISFTKMGIPPDERSVVNSLEIIELGRNYEGSEDNGNIQTVYSKID